MLNQDRSADTLPASAQLTPFESASFDLGRHSARQIDAGSVGPAVGAIFARKPATLPDDFGTGAPLTFWPDSSDLQQRIADYVRLYVSPTPRPDPAPVSEVLQEWEGYVVEIDGNEFIAHLIDLTAGDTEESEEATIPLREVSDADAKRMRPGSVFRWTIRYERTPSGGKRRVSEIVFREMLVFTDEDLRDAKAWARDMMKAFGR